MNMSRPDTSGPSMERATMLSEHHKRGTTAEAAAQKSRDESRHEEAKTFATKAIAEHRALYDMYSLEKKVKMKSDAASHVKRAEDLLGAIQTEAESVVKAAEEQKRRNESKQLHNKEHQDMTLGLDRLLKCVPGFTSHGLGILQKSDELCTFLNAHEQQHSDEITRLNGQLVHAEQARNEGQMRQQELLSRVRLLEAEQEEAMKEATDNNIGILDWFKDNIGLGCSSKSSTPLKAIIMAKKVENQVLKEENTQLQERLEEMERRINEELVCGKNLEDDYALLLIKANKAQDTTEQSACVIKQLKDEVAESLSLLAQQQEVYDVHVAQDKKKAAVQMERKLCVARFKAIGRGLRRIFGRWNEVISEEKQNRTSAHFECLRCVVMSMVASKRTHTTQKVGFERWSDATAEQKQHTAQTRRIVMRLMNRVQMEAWVTWNEQVRHNQHNHIAKQVSKTQGPLAPESCKDVYSPEAYQDNEEADRQVLSRVGIFIPCP